MSLHYILDGYNILHQMPISEKTDRVEEQRRQFIALVETLRPQGSLRNRVTVVFDGHAAAGLSSSAVSVVFSLGRSADEVIKKMVEESAHKKSIVVVTDDRDIQYSVRALGAGVCRVNEFLERMKSKPSSDKAFGKTEKGGYLSSKVKEDITQECAQVWIKKKQK